MSFVGHKTGWLFLLCIVCIVHIAGAAKHKVILDTDIGADLDDQVAVAYLAQEPQCELLGVTTVDGGADVRAAMVSAILRNVGREDVPVFPGLSKGVSANARVGAKAPDVAAVLEKWPHRTFPAECTAIEFMRKMIRENPHEITLVAIGPLSNVATLFKTDPTIPSLLAGLVVMGGNFSGETEWNAFCDPEATATVYDAWKGTNRFLSVGNDVTRKTWMNEADARKFFEGKKSLGPAYDLAQGWLNAVHYGILHDPLACVAAFHPEVCTCANALIKVSTNGPTAGACVRMPAARDRNGKPFAPHAIAKDADVRRFYEILSQTLR